MPMDSELPDDFAAGVLRRTTGSACEAAEPLLTALVDGELGRTERELVGSHIAHCAACHALVAVLGALGSDLRSFVDVEPDTGFVDDVLAVTCDALPAWSEWRRVLLLRPRFSLEAAFAGSILFILLFGVPGPGLATGSRAFLAEEIRAGAEAPLATAHRLWDRTAEPVAGSLATTGRVLLRTARRLARPSLETETSSPSPEKGAGAHDSPGENR